MSKHILFVSGHTYADQSLANATILKEMKAMYPNATFNHLMASNPNFTFDVVAEQQQLEQADIIVLQSPMFWFNVPSIK